MRKTLATVAIACCAAAFPLMADNPRASGEFYKTYYHFEIDAMKGAIDSIKYRLKSLDRDCKEFKEQIELINQELDFLQFCLTSTAH